MFRKKHGLSKKKLYESGMEILRQHHERICQLVMKSRKEGRGNFKYIDRLDIKRERQMAKILQLFLWRLRLELDKDLNKKGCCDIRCAWCSQARFNFHSKLAPDHWCNEQKEGWYCQYECECK